MPTRLILIASLTLMALIDPWAALVALQAGGIAALWLGLPQRGIATSVPLPAGPGPLEADSPELGVGEVAGSSLATLPPEPGSGLVLGHQRESTAPAGATSTEQSA